MITSIIAAVGKSGQLGLNGKLAWKIKDDVKNFRNLTLGHHLLMGRKTFQSIGRALPNRINLVVSSGGGLILENLQVFPTPPEAVKFAENNGETELFVIGGAKIYEFFLANGLVDRMYLTEVDYDGNADVFFPKFNRSDWNFLETQRFEKNDENEYGGIIRILAKY